MSYEVTEGSGCVSITLLVMGEVSVEYTVVADVTDGTATGECGGTSHPTVRKYACMCLPECSKNYSSILLDW